MTRRSRLGAAVLGVAGLATLLLWWGPNGGPARPPISAPARGSTTEQAEPIRAPEPFVVTPPSRLRERAPGAAAASPEPDMPDFCTGSEEELTPGQYATEDGLLRDRFDELVDRARASTASEARRDGVRLTLTREDEGGGLDRLLGAPDRVEDGFDFATNAAVVLGHRALAERNASAARFYGRFVSRHDTSDALGPLIVGLAAELEPDTASARSRLREAHRLAPDEPAIQLALARRLSVTVELEEAVRLLTGYRDAYPEDDRARRLLGRVQARRAALPISATVARDGVALRHSPTTVPAVEASGLVDGVLDGLVEAAEVLGTSRRAELAIFLYPTRAHMRTTLCAAGWTGAAYDGTLSLAWELMVDRVRGRRILRHEVMHAALHASIHRAPLWFDEGLAQHFAGEVSPAHYRSWRQMVRDRTWVPFPSLEGSFMVIHDQGDAGLAYHQSHAMVAWMVEYRGHRAIPEAVALLRTAPPGERVDLVPAELTGDALLDYLDLRLERVGR